ncbi:hypothetical protein [Paracoccus marcusii]|uniref:hypothetical protein n=1 Tax=Paracoccus marcusii TaxID=59779 RepID=UPI002ED18765
MAPAGHRTDDHRDRRGGAGPHGARGPDGLLASLVGIDEPTSRGILRDHLGADFDFPHLDRMWAEAMIERRDRDGIPLRPHVHTLLDALLAAGLPLPSRPPAPAIRHAKSWRRRG